MLHPLLNNFKVWLASVGLAALAAYSPLYAQQVPPASAAAQSVPSAAAGKSVPTTADTEEYRIGPQDLIEISVFQVQEMSRAVRVNAQGLISLPLIGIVRAGGLTATELETVIATKLSENLLQNPQVSVFIKEFVSQRVIVAGNVMKTGVYPLTGKTLLSQVIALTGGLDPVADPTNVKIFRDTPSGTREVLTFNLVAIRDGQVVDPLIKGNDTVLVEQSGSAAFVKGLTDTLRGFISFGTYGIR